jgi:hypothetical protein
MMKNSRKWPHKTRPLLSLFRLARFLFKGTRIQHLQFTSNVYSYLVKKIVTDVDTLSVNFRGQEFIVEGRDITLLPTLIDQTYERYEIDWFLSLIAASTDKKLFIDVGANIGIYTLLATKDSQCNVTCVAVEPDSRNLIKLARNIANSNMGDRVEILPCALGQASENQEIGSERYFFVSQYGATSRLARVGESPESESFQSVKVQSLDQIFDDFYSESYKLVIVKIDVEGFEPEVLMSGFNSIRRLKPFLLVEFTTDSSRSDNLGWTEDFLAQLFAIYSDVNLVDGSRTCTQISSPGELLKIPPYKLVNLIFTP